jgi:hypothetical protein
VQSSGALLFGMTRIAVFGGQHKINQHSRNVVATTAAVSVKSRSGGLRDI